MVGRLRCRGGHTPFRTGAIATAGLRLLLAIPPASAQTPPDTVTEVAADTVVAPAGALRVYLDCDECDFTYIRREIPFIDYVRDRQSAQLHVLITDQQTGGGGESNRLSFLGLRALAGADQELTYISQQSDTDDQRRAGLTRVLKMGLLRYVAQTPLAQRITIDYAAPAGESGPLVVADRWDHWVFEIGASGALDKESLQSEYSLDGSLSADRVREKWKVRSNAWFSFEEQAIERDSQTIRSPSHDTDISVDLVRSLTSRWSAALFSDLSSSTYTNSDREVQGTMGIEYNIFPWDISDRKLFTVAYTAGIRSSRYIEETIYDRLSETRPVHALRANTEFTQPWGRIRGELEGSQYLSAPEKYRLNFGTDVSLRITRGLSFDLEVNAESIHDQLYLPKGDATLEEILLRRRQLATTYEISTRIGLSYTFGSIYNNVINPRF